MYNSRRLSRSSRTLQRRKVDTGTVIDPSKVQAYLEYLLNNGYVQLPQPAPSPDGSYLFVANPDLPVPHLMSNQIIAQNFIASVLSTQNIYLNGSETVYMELQTTLNYPNDTSFTISIYNTSISSAKYITDIKFSPYYISSNTLTIAFIYCNGRYSIVLRGTSMPDPDGIEIDKNVNVPDPNTKTYIAFSPSASITFGTSKVTIATVGREE